MTLTPAETAQNDQEKALARDEVYTYVETNVLMVPKYGDHQSAANLYVLLKSHGHSPEALRVLLVEAVQMLAAAGIRAPWAVSDAG